LRKAICNRVAEDGCDVVQIIAITGPQNLAEMQAKEARKSRDGQGCPSRGGKRHGENLLTAATRLAKSGRKSLIYIGDARRWYAAQGKGVNTYVIEIAV